MREWWGKGGSGCGGYKRGISWMVRRECGRTKEGGCRKTEFGKGRREIDGEKKFARFDGESGGKGNSVGVSGGDRAGCG